MDRNSEINTRGSIKVKSLSARRAWIEIGNSSNMLYNVVKSLSARRAWIEMFSVHEVFANFEVALRKESVDRNLCIIKL